MTGAFSLPVEGATLVGERRGVGTPLVLIHGMAGDREEWAPLLRHWPRNFPTLAYDLRGFGASSRLDGTAYSHSEDLLALLDAMGIEQLALCGLSMGGGVALNFALNYPEQVTRLVLISPAMVGWEWSEEWRTLWSDVAQVARSGERDLARSMWLDHPMFATLRGTDHENVMRKNLAVYHGDQWVRDYQRAELPDVDRLHALGMPMLLVTGEHDVPDIRLIADVIAAAAPDVTRRDYADAGHMVHMERSETVAETILDFCR